MTGKSLRHIFHYSILLIMMVAGIIAIIFTGRNLSAQTGIVILIGFAYFVWGLVHHALERTLHAEVVIEYLLLAALGIGSVLGVLYYL